MTDTLRRMVVAEGWPQILGGGLSVVAVRGAAAPAPQAHLTVPYWPCCSLDQQTAGWYLGRLSTPSNKHVPIATQLLSTLKG